MEKENIIKDLKKLSLTDVIALDSFMDLEFEYEPIINFIENLKIKSKPETAANELMRDLLNDVIGNKVGSEVRYERDFIDFIIDIEGKGNPVCIELKPMFYLDASKRNIKQGAFRYELHQKQIQKYLRHKRVEYVVLTNVHRAFIFNRSALIDYKPFAETTLYQIFEDFLQFDSLWDTIRRIEDNIELANLDNEFFVDLKKWFNEFKIVNVVEEDSLSKEEVIVLLLNQIIFIKTLEDYGLVPYRFIQDDYDRLLDLWSPKKLFNNMFDIFFRDIVQFFEMFYDTELFNLNVWNYIDKDKNNILRFKQVFERILGLGAWSQTYGKGLVHYNYRQINEDIFGKAYETWIAENKKDEGIFYTPESITEYMANLLVDSLFDDAVNKLIEELNKSLPDESIVIELREKFRSIRIIDPTSGSGSFLIKVLRKIFEKYKKLNEATKWVRDNVEESDDLSFNLPANIRIVRQFRTDMFFNFGSELRLISSIILNHIFAVDKDERAIDTAKTNIWKEAVKLHPQIYNYRRLEEHQMHVLPNLAMNFLCGDSLTDFDFEAQQDIISTEFKNELIRMFQIRNYYLKDPYKPEVISEVIEIKKKIRHRLEQEHNGFKDSLYYPLEFFFAFFDKNGNKLPVEKSGFDGIISNPPWEAIKPVKKEFAKLGKYDMDILHFKKWFKDKLENDPDFKNGWNKYVSYYEQYTEYLYGKYERQSSGDPNYYKFFIERDFQLIKDNAYFCLLVPSGFQTDEGSNKLRELLIENYHLLELSSFENRGYFKEEEKYKVKLFPDVDNRFKFSIVFAKKENLNGEKHHFKAKFYMHHPDELKDENHIDYDIHKIRQFSPENLSIMEFRSERDYELCLKIKDEHKLFRDNDFRLRREFDMTNDSSLFHSFEDLKKHKGEPFLRLYEGKMIHQFTSSFANPRYFLKEEEARPVLLRKVIHRIKSQHNLSKAEIENLIIPEDLLLDYQTYRLVYRAIGRSTDERSLISSIVPKNVYIGNSLIHNVNLSYFINQRDIKYKSITDDVSILTMSLLNSLTLNYYIRNKISANLNMFFIYELPIAEADEETKEKIVQLGFSLLYRKSNKSDFEDLKKELNIEIDKRENLAEIRAELEIIIARKLYKLSKVDWEYLTSTFIFGGESDTKAELDEIIQISKDLWENVMDKE